jgi:hypothetical protein
MLVTTKKVRKDWLEVRTSTSSDRQEKAWTSLWKTKVPSKIKVFAWRLANHSLPTGDVLDHRNMSTLSVYAICHATNDSWRHSLLDCTMARCIWALTDEHLTEHVCISTCSDAKEWVFHPLETTSHTEFITILITLWAIWTTRRKAIHESILQSPVTVIGFVQRYLSDLSIVNAGCSRSLGASARAAALDGFPHRLSF